MFQVEMLPKSKFSLLGISDSSRFVNSMEIQSVYFNFKYSLQSIHHLHCGRTGPNVLVDVELRCKCESVYIIVVKTKWRFDSVQQIIN